MSIKKLDTDLWQLRLTYIDRAGVKQDLRRQFSGSFVEAKALEAELVALKRRGELDRWVAEAQSATDFAPLSKSMTFEEFSVVWLRDHAKPRMKPGSYQSAEGHLRIHINPALGAKPLEAVRPKDVADLLNGIAATRSPHTANNVRATIQSLMTAAVRWELLERNPVTREKVPSVKLRRTKRFENFLTPEEARSFLAAISRSDEHRERFPLYLFLISTGVRFGEAAALRLVDLDLTKARATIFRSVRQGEESSTKGDDERTVALPSALVAALRTHVEALAARPGANPKRLVFPNAIGGFLTPESLRWSFRSGLTEAGIKKHVTIHGLRHSFCTMLALDGRSALEIASRAGHAQAATSERYIHLAEASKLTAPSIIEALSANFASM